MTVYRWSQTAANNDGIDSTINYQEGQSPGSLNNSGRAVMAAIAKWRDDTSGALTTGGAATAYTVTTNQGYASLIDGMSVTVRLHATNGATPTLAVDALGAKPITVDGSAAPHSGALREGGVFSLTYSASDEAWIWQQLPDFSQLYQPLNAILTDLATNDTIPAPVGTKIVLSQTTAPTGWTKDTTHNDKALRVVSGSASSGGSVAFSTCFADRTIAASNLPVTSPWSIIDAPHRHTLGANLDSGSGTNDGSYYDYQRFSPNASYTGYAYSGVTLNTNSGGGQPIDFRVQYVDTIICTRNARA